MASASVGRSNLSGEVWPLKKHAYGSESGMGATDSTPRLATTNDSQYRKPRHAGWHDLDVFASFRAPSKGIKRGEVEDPHFYSVDDLSGAFRYVPPVRRVWRRIWRLATIPVLLALIGVGTACIASAVNMSAAWGQDKLRTPLVAIYPSIQGWALYMAAALLLAATSFVVSQALCADSTGGGIPDVKTVLSGTVKTTTLSFRMLLAKMLGLPIALIAGLSIGREGPFVHMACCLADVLMRLPCFENVRLNASKRIEVLSCAVAAGVASTFGTPFGGVLFSIETTSVCFMVNNLPPAFFCSMCGATFLALMGLGDYMTLFSETVSKNTTYSRWDVCFFTLLGVVCGLLGVVFVQIVHMITRARNQLVEKLKARERRRLQITMVVVATALVSPFVYLDLARGLHGDLRTMKEYLFTQATEDLDMKLVLYVPYKLLATCICVCLPLPVGLFTPTFITGGAIGRVFGDLLHQYLPSYTMFEPWEFAVMGSAAYSAGVTRAVSTAVILFELSGETHIRLPVGITILVAYFISNWFNENIYNVLINTNKTPHLPLLPPSEYFRQASDVMEALETLPLLTLTSSYAEGRQLLQEHNLHVIPVVETLKSMSLVGSIYRADLVRALQEQELKLDVVTNSSDAEAPRNRTTLLEETLSFIVLEAGHVPVLVESPGAASPSLGRRSVAGNAALLKKAIVINQSPLEVVNSMSIGKVDHLFRMLKVNFVFVNGAAGRLVGVITRSRMRAYLSEQKRPWNLRWAYHLSPSLDVMVAGDDGDGDDGD